MSPFASGALGALTVLVLAGLLRHARWHHRAHRGGWLLRRLYRRLGTRPEQEEVLSAEAESLASEVRALRRDASTMRDELADLIAGPALEPGAVAAAVDARLEKLRALKARISDGLARVHTTLDPAQRARLAELLRGGPHRCHGHVNPV